MKLRDLGYMLGRPKPAPKDWGYEVEPMQLAGFPPFRFAHWRNPRVHRVSFNPQQVAALQSFLRPGDMVIDIGAHSGDTAVPFGLATGPDGLVLAFEPNPHVFEILRQNAELNRDVMNIEPLMLAAAESDTQMTFDYSDADFTNGGLHKDIGTLRHGHVFKLTVQGVRLPRLLAESYADALPRLRFVKIDAEGYDLSIARTLEPVLKQHRPHVQIEVFRHVAHAQRLEMHAYFSGLGYRVLRVQSLEDLFGPPIAPAQMSDAAHFDLMCVPA